MKIALLLGKTLQDLECCSTTGESPVIVILKSSNINVHKDGAI
jgi:hypothetical protein